MKHFYVYYSYEEYGRGYIGKRECNCPPEEDTNYFGSYTDSTFFPTNKIILQTFEDAESALQAECVLHEFYQVDSNSHFANKAKQTSTKFYCNLGPGKSANEKRRELMKTEYNPMSDPEIKERARRNLIKSLKSPSSRRKRRLYTKEISNRPEEILRRRQCAIKSHQDPRLKKIYSECKMGENNPCYGKRWATNGEKNIYVNPSDTLPIGFWYGRTLSKT